MKKEGGEMLSLTNVATIFADLNQSQLFKAWPLLIIGPARQQDD